MIKKTITFLLSCMTHVRFFLFHRCVKLSRGRAYLIRFRNGGAGNSFLSDGGEVAFLNLGFEGGNNVFVNHGRLNRCRIVFEGENNRLEIGADSIVRSSKLILRGNNLKIAIGERVDIGGMTAVCQGEGKSITIGDDCLLSTDIDLWASDTHVIRDKDGSILNPSESIRIGKHVWLGKRAAVLKGCSVGDNSVIGFGSVVTRNIPGNVVAAGNPASVLKQEVDWDKELIDI